MKLFQWLKPRALATLVPAIALAGCVAILLLLAHLSRDVDYHGMMRALRHLPVSSLAASVAATVTGYATLVARDATLLRLMGLRIARLPLLLGSICGSALGNAVGTGALTGGAVRYRVYGAVGVRPEQVAKLMLLITLSFSGGLVLLTALSGLAVATGVASMAHLPVMVVRGVSGLVVAAAIVLLLMGDGLGPDWRLGRWEIPRPSRRAMSIQFILVAADLLTAAAALWVLLPAGRPDLAEFVAIFSVATALGVISHVPGGLGVFEAVVLFALRGRAAGEVAAALLAFRAIYFLLPLLLSGVFLAGFELRAIRSRLPAGSGERFVRLAEHLAPPFLGAVTFALGGMLVLSGATPAFGYRLALLRPVLPLWLLETSHFLASLLGILLLFVARGLFQRLDGAWWLAMSVTAASLVLSLAKGLAVLEATALLMLLGMLWGMRHRFNRPASLFRQRLTARWFVAVTVVLLIAGWVFLLAFRDVPYTRDLWWQFEFDARAPRALRATFAAGLLAATLAIRHLLQVAPPPPRPPTAAEVAQAAAIVRAQDRSGAMLALMGDKNFLFSASGRSFLMYGRRGRSWAALNDPVGPREEWEELVLRFMEMAWDYGGRVGFYQVRPESLPIYLDAGLKVIKLGEEAVVHLDRFSLEGSKRSHLRYALKRGERDGLSFSLVLPAETAELMPEVNDVSDAWLRGHPGPEKAFSVAALRPGFVAEQAIAVVRENGRATAFATLMLTEHKIEAGVGVMRHQPDASPYAMEFLFTRLALHLKQAGYRRLNLGMAPLAGLSPTPLASAWHHVASLIWQHAGRLYNFQGLRGFKRKFTPDWEPRYLAASGLSGPFLVLADVAVLTGIQKDEAMRGSPHLPDRAAVGGEPGGQRSRCGELWGSSLVAAAGDGKGSGGAVLRREQMDGG